MIADNLLRKHRIISEQIRADELKVLLIELERVVRTGVVGDLVELGCYEGTSALFEQRLLLELDSEKKLWLYDSFEGLPEKTTEDVSAAGELFKEGELKASKARLDRNFHKAGLRPPHVKRAWFYELEDADLPDEICFAFLDGDFIIVDDYQSAALPGAKKAVDWWVAEKGFSLRVEKSLAILTLSE